MTRRRILPKVYLYPASVWELLDQHNMCQNELAQLSGISPRPPSRLMSQTRRPRLICGGGGARPWA